MKITETTLKSLSSPTSYARGGELYSSGAIYDTFRQGNVLTGKCEGRNAPFYQLRVTIDEGGIQVASCTCPYDGERYCKHIIALMLTYIHDPDIFLAKQQVEELLVDLDRESLVRLIGELVDKDPDLYLWLQAAIQSDSAKSNPAQSPEMWKVKVVKADYLKQIRGILRSLSGYRRSETYWMMSGLVEQLQAVSDSAYVFLEAGDPESALVIFTTLLTEVGGSYEEFDDSDGELASFLDDLALPIVEAVLSVDLGKSQRRQLAKELKPVIDDLAAYGVEELDVILTALKDGWSIEMSRDSNELDYESAIFIQAQLNVLEYQNRTDEFLKLCVDTGQYLRHILKQIEVGSYEQAMDIAWKSLTHAHDALLVARRLHDAGCHEDALRLAEKGLGLDGDKRGLGAWLGPIEETHGRVEQAIQAYQAAFTGLPSLEHYQILKRLSKKDWGVLKPALMRVFEEDRFVDELVDIYLFEKELDAAIAVVDRIGSWQYRVIEKVVDAVISVRPDWAIQASRKQAQALIDKTQSKYYAIAVHWLAKMKQAYLVTGRKSEWQTYLDSLKSTYARRPALQAELRKL